MSVAVNSLCDQVRRSVRDYPAKDTLQNGLDVGDTVIFVNNAVAGYQPSRVIVIDQEAILVTSQVVGDNQFNVIRGWLGTTPATHSADAPILIDPRFSPTDILDAVNEGLRSCWPYFFQLVDDTSLTTTSELQADYALPAAFGQVGFVTSMDILMPGRANSEWRKWRWFRHIRGASGATLSLVRQPPAGTRLRLVGIAPWATDLAFGGTTDALMADFAVTAIRMYARYYLKLLDEDTRQNQATAKNIGPAAVPAGQNASLAQLYYQQYQQFCIQHAQRFPRWRTRRVL